MEIIRYHGKMDISNGGNDGGNDGYIDDLMGQHGPTLVRYFRSLVLLVGAINRKMHEQI